MGCKEKKVKYRKILQTQACMFITSVSYSLFIAKVTRDVKARYVRDLAAFNFKIILTRNVAVEDLIKRRHFFSVIKTGKKVF